MEKQGMDRRKRLFGAGLLKPLQVIFVLVFFVLSAFHGSWLWADDGETLEVQIETYPSDPMVNNPWSVYILVKHPSPREVNVEPPRFPSSLALERVRAEVKISEQGERWTRVEFLFTPLRADTITLEPFEVRTPTRKAMSAPVNASFSEETVRRRYNPALRWLGAASPIRTGESGELILELSNWDPVKKIPQGFFQGQAPVNAILEESLPVEVTEGVYHYTIRVIPLQGSVVRMEPILFYSDIYSLTVPGINISVLPARPDRFREAEGQHDSANDVPDSGDKIPDEINDEPPDEIFVNKIEQLLIERPPFPATREKVFPLFRREYNQIISRAEALWDESSWAESLAELRKNERDSLSGPFLISVRREVEQMMGLGLTENENWHPLKIPLLLWVSFLFLVLLAAAFLLALRARGGVHKMSAGLHRGSGFATIIVLLFALVLAFFFLEESLGFFRLGNGGSSGKAAVLRGTIGYRIPDLKGAVSDRFDEGQPVIVGNYMGGWCFAETPDGRSGWVPGGSVIVY